MDPFTQKRLLRVIEKFRGSKGELPTLADLAKEGFDKAAVDDGIRLKLIEELYLNLTDGSVRKVYKTS